MESDGSEEALDITGEYVIEVHVGAESRSLKRQTVSKWPAAGQGFKITKWPAVWYFSQISRNRRDSFNPNYHMSINNRQAIQRTV